MKGLVSNIQKYSVTDGYGIRTIVFLLGCAMRCKWCQNPETWLCSPSLMYDCLQCAGCGNCAKNCPIGKGGAARSADCEGCFACVEMCPYRSLKMSGVVMDTSEVLAEVMQDEVFYKETSGGLTVSGGEPLMQADFVKSLLKPVHDQGISTAVETAGYSDYENFKRIIPYTDIFLYDIKLLDCEAHILYTGVSNKKILENLNNISKLNCELIIRVPLIPGVNDGDEFKRIADYAAALSGVHELHILPFHNLGASKYDHLGMEYEFAKTQENSKEAIASLSGYAQSLGLRVSVGGHGFNPNFS